MIVTTNLKSKRIGCSHNRGTKVTVVDAGSAHSVLTVCTCFNMGYKLVNFSKVSKVFFFSPAFDSVYNHFSFTFALGFRRSYFF